MKSVHEGPLSSKGTAEAKGFTFIELMVVITLMSIILLFVVPRFSESLFPNTADTTARWIIYKVKWLKEHAVRDQKNYYLNADLEIQRLWVTDDAMAAEAEDEAAAEQAMQAALEAGYSIPEGVRLSSVEFPSGERIDIGHVKIGFYKKGYSDGVILQLDSQDERRLFLIVKPFLSDIKIVEEDSGE